MNESGLPSTVAELRERSRVCRDAARETVDPAAKREIAAYAFALAQVAEAMERDPGFTISGAYRGVVEKALERARTIVREAPGGTGPDPHAQIRAWRMRAEEMRTTADSFALPSAQETLRLAAANYDRLADQAEVRLSRLPAKSKDRAG
jgi:hypothetical protein